MSDIFAYICFALLIGGFFLVLKALYLELPYLPFLSIFFYIFRLISALLQNIMRIFGDTLGPQFETAGGAPDVLKGYKELNRFDRGGGGFQRSIIRVSEEYLEFMSFFSKERRSLRFYKIGKAFFDLSFTVAFDDRSLLLGFAKENYTKGIEISPTNDSDAYFDAVRRIEIINKQLNAPIV